MNQFPNTLWSSLPIAGLLVDPGNVVVEANMFAEGFFNTSARGLQGGSVFDRMQIDIPFEQALTRVRHNQAPLFVNKVDVGGAHHAAESCNVQIAPMMGMTGFVLILIEPRQMADRLSHVGAARSSARSAIGMSEMLAHEIKNPLAGITGAAQLLSMELAPKDRQLTDLIVAESRRIVALLEQVEQFGNLRPPARCAVNVHDLLDRARRSAVLGFAGHMRLVESYDPSLPHTYVDDDQMIQVILNLIRNATEAAGPEGGTVTIRTFYDHALRLRAEDGSGSALPLQVEISDDGPGIPSELAEGIFDPFVSGRENGTGLGLALVSKIIGEHQALISLESRPGRTAFRISLPLAPNGAADI